MTVHVSSPPPKDGGGLLTVDGPLVQYQLLACQKLQAPQGLSYRSFM